MLISVISDGFLMDSRGKWFLIYGTNKDNLKINMPWLGTKKAVLSRAAKDKKPHDRKARQETGRASSLPIAHLGGQGTSIFDTAAVALIKWLLFPVVIAASLAGCFLSYGQDFDEDFLVLAIVSFLLASHIFDEANLYRQQPKFPLTQAASSILLKWALMIGFLWILAVVTRMSGQFPRKPLLAWIAVTPIALLMSQLLARLILRAVVAQSSHRSAIIIGANPLGCELFTKIDNDAYLGIKVLGFFDDREQARLPTEKRGMLIGQLDAVADYVRKHNIDLVYLSLPMLAQPRILNLLADLRDSTTSVYFVPDMLLFDLINARFDRISGVPVVSILDTPYFGVRGPVKRLSDILIASFVLLLVFPVMALIAVGIKLSSRGPILFKQRRYGLDGEEIKVYKFRSMTVAEDGDCVVQAKKNDRRVTPFGKFLRATSLDELPQFINVLQGCMSIVGPRPHAVAHNEMYRKLIKGYMLRHKVKPGITGWAQIRYPYGASKEDALEKLRYDLYYIKNMSLLFDLLIILETIKVVLFGKGAR
jgi:putative colanic acid biosynthesis UDP-glucose lipid carrier transferase